MCHFINHKKCKNNSQFFVKCWDTETVNFQLCIKIWSLFRKCWIIDQKEIQCLKKFMKFRKKLEFWRQIVVLEFWGIKNTLTIDIIFLDNILSKFQQNSTHFILFHFSTLKQNNFHSVIFRFLQVFYSILYPWNTRNFWNFQRKFFSTVYIRLNICRILMKSWWSRDQNLSGIWL